MPRKKLTVLSGDATDADGCIELAQIAKSGADVLYIMHISQPFNIMGPKFETILEEVKGLGLPFPKQGEAFNERVARDDKSYLYGTKGEIDALIRRSLYAFTQIFEENKTGDSRIFFRFKYGAKHFFNKRNPFGLIWRSELETFTDAFDALTVASSAPIPNLNDYSEVILDISGSTAFWGIDIEAKNFLLAALNSGKLKYVVVMGSVETSEPPKTLLLSGVMQRHPMATMNQLYDPESFTDIVDKLSSAKWVIVTNNVVNRIADYTKMATKEEFTSFILEKVVKTTSATPVLRRVLDNFYVESAKFKWKLFDCLTGKIIFDHVTGATDLSEINPERTVFGTTEQTSLFTEPNYGVTIVGPDSELRNYLAANPELPQIGGRILPGVVAPSFTVNWYD